MKIPDKLTIGGITYDIKIVDPQSLELLQTTIGHIWYEKNLIVISKDLNEDKQAQTLCHELLHGLFLAMGYAHDFDVKVDERFVDALASYLHQIMEQIIDYNQK